MIVDTSAIIAILRQEPDAERFALALAGAQEPEISAATFLETAIVVDASRDPIASRRLDEFMGAAGLNISLVTEVQARLAREAYRDFGKGSGHKAQLNFGDCFSYALSRATGRALLFKGTDFTHTDIQPALP